MNHAAIFHCPQSAYAFALDDTHYVFRLRTQRGDVTKCVFHWADRAAMTPELSFAALAMTKVRSDMLWDWFEARLETPLERIAYYFELNEGRERCFYYGDCLEAQAEHIRSECFQLPYNHRADRLTVPAWAAEAVVYNIFPDSFASAERSIRGSGESRVYQGEASRSRLGGTLEGIRENLDYIAGLGCNCLYLNPFFAAQSYHKYDLLDYEHVDPCLGTDENFRLLVRDAHARDMRVIIDGVFNHTGWRHPAFQEVLEKGRDARHFSWYYRLPERPRFPETGEMPEYACFAYVAEMPKTDTADPALCDYFCRIGRYWVQRFGVDGWRLDVANEMSDGFLRAFRQAVKAVKPDALIIGEVWENAAHYLNGDMLDSAMNYDFRRFAGQFFATESLNAEEFDLRVSQMLMRYKTPALYAQLNLLDSHDVARFLSLCGGNVERMELAILFQMTFPGMPSIFYGDELGLEGQEELEYRQPMPWGCEHSLYACYAGMIALRREHPALTHGDYTTCGTWGRCYCYARSGEGETLTICLNAGLQPAHIPFVGTPLLQKNLEHGILGAYGYAVLISGRRADGGNDL